MGSPDTWVLQQGSGGWGVRAGGLAAQMPRFSPSPGKGKNPPVPQIGAQLPPPPLLTAPPPPNCPQMKNADYFSNYVTEDFTTYINRKRKSNCHGNHIEMQAMAEMYNRPVEVYQYGTGALDASCYGRDGRELDA